MRGFPKVINTKEDFENLLGMEEHKEEALIKLQEMQDHDDRVVTKSISDPNKADAEFEIVEIENPNPIHTQKGFSEWMDVVKLNAETQKVETSEILEKYTVEEIEKTADIVVKT